MSLQQIAFGETDGTEKNIIKILEKCWPVKGENMSPQQIAFSETDGTDKILSKF